MRGSEEVGAAVEDSPGAGIVTPITSLFSSLPWALQRPDTSWGTAVGHWKPGEVAAPQLRHSCCASCRGSHTCSVAFDTVSYFFPLSPILGRPKAVLLHMTRKTIVILYCSSVDRCTGVKEVGGVKSGPPVYVIYLC